MDGVHLVVLKVNWHAPDSQESLAKDDPKKASQTGTAIGRGWAGMFIQCLERFLSIIEEKSTEIEISHETRNELSCATIYLVA